MNTPTTSENVLQPGTAKTSVRTKNGYQETNHVDPNNGSTTITRTFSLTTDPFILHAGQINVFELHSMVINISKVTNQNNTTTSFAVLSWTPKYNYRCSAINMCPKISLSTLNQNNGEFETVELGVLEAQCGANNNQSANANLNAQYFDLVVGAVFTIESSAWEKC